VIPRPRSSPDELQTLGQWEGDSLTIHVCGSGDYAEVAVAGELDITVADRLAEVLDVADRGGATHLLVLASDLEFIDFAGVEVLVVAARRADLRGGSLAISGANPDVAEVLTFSGQRRLMLDHATTQPTSEAEPRLRSFTLEGVVDAELVRARWFGGVLECDPRLRRWVDIVGATDGCLLPATGTTGRPGTSGPDPFLALVALIRACDRVVSTELEIARAGMAAPPPAGTSPT